MSDLLTCIVSYMFLLTFLGSSLALSSMERLESLQTHFLAVQSARKTLGNISEVILVVIV